MDITSLQNPRIKYLVRLRDDKRQRLQEGLMLVEGRDEIQMALNAGYRPRTLLTAPELSRESDFQPEETEHLTLARAVFEKVSYRENPDGWLGVFPIPRLGLEDLQLKTPALLVLAESIEKPGNLGAILRTAEAAGADGLLVCDERVDPWNPNVVRASRGTLFRVPVIETDNPSALKWLRGKGIHIIAATPQAQETYTRANLRQSAAIAVGTEDSGLSEFWMKQADEKVKIPMFGMINSLNVSIATALMVYEAVRQRGGVR